MIPKVIHYCWFGGKELPALANKCIASWKKYLPDYEIKRWDESNFDVNIIPYTSQAYAAKKYAFVSDYARFWILYNFGGLYFDTDVEIIKPFDDIVAAGNFMGCETPVFHDGIQVGIKVNPGLGLGTCPKNDFFGEILNMYQKLDFVLPNPTTVVAYTTSLLENKGLQNTNSIQRVCEISIYPSDYFSPINQDYHDVTITEHTHSIHHFAGTWMTAPEQFKLKFFRFVGPKTSRFLVSIKRRLKKLLSK